MNLSLKGAGTRFAHLLGLPNITAKAEGDDDAKDEKATARAEGDDAGDEKDKDKKDKDKKAANDKGEKAAGDDEKDQNKDKDGDDKAKAQTYADGVKAERDRWDAVMASDGTAGRVPFACALLTKTDMSAADVIETLASTPQATVSTAKSTRLDERMRTAPPPNPGAGAENPQGDLSEADNLVGKILAAGKIARGEK